MKNGKSQMKKGILMLMVLAMIGCTLAFASAESAAVDDANHTEAVEQDRSDSDVENVNNSILNSLLPPDIRAQDSEDIDETQDDDTEDEDEEDQEDEDDSDEDDDDSDKEDKSSESNNSMNELYGWIGRIVAALDDWNEEYTPIDVDGGYGYDDYDADGDSWAYYDRDQGCCCCRGCCCRGCSHGEDYIPRDFYDCERDWGDEKPRHHEFRRDGMDFPENRDGDDDSFKGGDPWHDGNEAFDMIR